MKHLEFSSETHPVITSILNFYVYFWTQRFVTHPDLITPYLHQLNEVKKHIPKKGVWTTKFYQHVPNINLFRQEHPGVRNARYSYNTSHQIIGIDYDQLESQKLIILMDFNRFIPDTSDGLTPTGLKLLNQSIEAYVYAVLGRQAKTRVSIVSGSAGSL